MLEIPEQVEQLLRRTSIRKNFRIHFPNGEREDIISNNLVSESVTLTESLCSEANLKFGLCEASTLEFTTIDVGNIKGCVIQTQLEVDLSLLSAEEITEFAVYPEDLDYPVYQIPYGVFTIDSCRRQNDLIQRDVVAYSEVYHADSGLSPIEQAKQQFGIRANIPYTIGAMEFLVSNVKNVDEAVYVTPSKMPPWNVELDHIQRFVHSSTGWTWEYRVSRFRIELSEEVTNDDLFDNVYRANFIVNQSAFEMYNETYKEYQEAGGDEGGENYQYPVQVRIGTKDKMELRVPVNGDYAIYPGIGYYKDYVFDIEFTTEVLARYNGNVALHAYLLNDEPSLVGYTLDNSLQISFARKKSGSKYYVDTEIHYGEIINAHLELNGMFGRAGRNGKYQFVTLGNLDGLLPAEDLFPADDLYPDDGWDAQAEKSLYYDLWYDEYVIQPYGRVVATYRNTEGELVEYSHQFEPENPNTYYIRDNIILQNGSYTEEEIEELLTTSLIPNLPSAGYVPLELECVGLPYMEAGDRIEVETREGCLKTYIMQRTLTGIQGLTDTIEVSGDELNTGGN